MKLVVFLAIVLFSHKKLGKSCPLYSKSLGTQKLTWLTLRGGGPDLSSYRKFEKGLCTPLKESLEGKGLTVSLRDVKYSVMTPKQRAEIEIMGSNEMESRAILEVIP
jgi:hypothetical protein